ncbi:hypothetical protein MHK_003149, partial [Candidatus Magnetomorum sp. HK-1]
VPVIENTLQETEQILNKYNKKNLLIIIFSSLLIAIIVAFFPFVYSQYKNLLNNNQLLSTNLKKENDKISELQSKIKNQDKLLEQERMDRKKLDKKYTKLNEEYSIIKRKNDELEANLNQMPFEIITNPIIQKKYFNIIAKDINKLEQMGRYYYNKKYYLTTDFNINGVSIISLLLKNEPKNLEYSKWLNEITEFYLKKKQFNNVIKTYEIIKENLQTNSFFSKELEKCKINYDNSKYNKKKKSIDIFYGLLFHYIKNDNYLLTDLSNEQLRKLFDHCVEKKYFGDGIFFNSRNNISLCKQGINCQSKGINALNILIYLIVRNESHKYLDEKFNLIINHFKKIEDKHLLHDFINILDIELVKASIYSISGVKYYNKFKSLIDGLRDEIELERTKTNSSMK